MARSFVILLLGTAALLVTACADDYGEPCDLPQSGAIQAFCEPEVGEDGSSSATCVFTNSTQCETRMCATYIGSEGFCTTECTPGEEGTCAAGSICQAIPATDLAFCVPPRILEASE